MRTLKPSSWRGRGNNRSYRTRISLQSITARNDMSDTCVRLLCSIVHIILFYNKSRVRTRYKLYADNNKYNIYAFCETQSRTIIPFVGRRFTYFYTYIRPHVACKKKFFLQNRPRKGRASFADNRSDNGGHYIYILYTVLSH